MTNENRIKTEALNEVIEYMNEMYINGKTHPFVYINDIKQKLYTMMRPDENESLLPKEEAIDWSKASYEELKKEAEKYIGKTAKCLEDGELFRIDCIYDIDYTDVVWAIGSKISTGDEGWSFVIFKDSKWAEIIPDRQIKEPVIHEVKSEPTQEIKVGDEVEYFNNHTQEWQSPNKPVIFTGGRARNGNYVLQDCHGFFSMDQIRKPLQKTQEEMDREMRDAVKKFCSEDFAEDLFDEELQKLIDHGRNTKQN